MAAYLPPRGCSIAAPRFIATSWLRKRLEEWKDAQNQGDLAHDELLATAVRKDPPADPVRKHLC